MNFVRLLSYHATSRSLPEFTHDELEECLAEDTRFLNDAQIPAHLAQPTLPQVYGAYTVNYDLLSLDVLVDLRTAHQTRHAACSTRTQAIRPAQTSDMTKPLSIRQSILRSFHISLKKSQDLGITTGNGRYSRWTGIGAQSEPVGTRTGNALNAAAAAAVRTRESSVKRKHAFLKTQAPCYNNGLSEANISTDMNERLKAGRYAFIYLEDGIALGKGISFAVISMSDSAYGVVIQYSACDLFQKGR